MKYSKLSKQELEDYARTKYGVAKVKEDLYGVKSVSFISGSNLPQIMDVVLKNPTDYLQGSAISKLNEVAGESGRLIAVTLKKADIYGIQIVASNMESGSSVYFDLGFSLDDSTRTFIVMLLGSVIERPNVEVGFYDYYTYNGLVELLEKQE